MCVLWRAEVSPVNKKFFGVFNRVFPDIYKLCTSYPQDCAFGWANVYVVACFTLRGEVDIMGRLIWIQPILQKAYKF